MNLSSEITSVKDKIVECRDNLKQILLSKNVEVLEEENKLSNLIGKVNELGDAPPPPMFLYKDGNEHVDITGGIVNVGNTGNMANKTFTKLENTFTYQVAGTKAANMTNNGFVTNNIIDCTKYSKLIFKYKINDFQNPTYEFDIEHRANSNKLYTGTKYSSITHYKPHTVSNIEKEVVVDISSVKNAYIGIWFRIGGYGNLIIEVSEIRLES